MSDPAKQVPQYKLLGPVYLSDTMYYNQQAIDNAPEGGHIVNYLGIPNANMMPLNDAAREMVKKHKHHMADPLDTLTRITPLEADTPAGMAKLIGASIAEALRGFLPGAKKNAATEAQQ